MSTIFGIFAVIGAITLLLVLMVVVIVVRIVLKFRRGVGEAMAAARQGQGGGRGLSAHHTVDAAPGSWSSRDAVHESTSPGRASGD